MLLPQLSRGLAQVACAQEQTGVFASGSGDRRHASPGGPTSILLHAQRLGMHLRKPEQVVVPQASPSRQSTSEEQTRSASSARQPPIMACSASVATSARCSLAKRMRIVPAIPQSRLKAEDKAEPDDSQARLPHRAGRRGKRRACIVQTTALPSCSCRADTLISNSQLAIARVRKCALFIRAGQAHGRAQAATILAMTAGRA